ncbi:MAG: Rho termination factor N-terminal domain-containing protein, partial [Actinobacteria bacterium]|nr:Rho termination factor N-terminal domain-containing protein [Actinomycetota bacterium]
AKKNDAGTSDEATADGQDRPRSVEEKRAAEKAAKKQAKAKNGGSNGKKDEEQTPDGLPAGIDEQLVADLQGMTVKQLRDRAAQDGVPGRSEMSKDELVVALATRETDDVPAKA